LNKAKEQYEREKQLEIEKAALYEKERSLPINNLDSAWMSAEPDYTNVQNTYNESSPNYAKIFSIFNSGMRLSKLSSEEAKCCQYDLVTAADALDLGLIDFALSVFFDVASTLETRQSVKGFRTDAMNKITQEIKQIQESNTNGKNVFGGKKEDE
jgi:hypothetical protein